MSRIYYEPITPINIGDYIEWRLGHWAKVLAREADHGLGYPSRSIEHRILTEGIIPVNQPGIPRPVMLPPAAEEMEYLVRGIYMQEANSADALRRYYLDRGTIREKAHDLGLPHSRFINLVDYGRHWLLGWFSAEFLRYCIYPTVRIIRDE